MPGLSTAVFAIVGLTLAYRDPRSLLPGVLLTLAAISIATGIFQALFDYGTWFARVDEDTRNLIAGLLLLLIPTIATAVLVVYLIVNGVVMITKERASLAHMLSLLTGLGTLALILLGIVSLLLQWWWIGIGLFLLMLPLGYLAIGFFSYLCWSVMYAFFARRMRNPKAIVALGAGLNEHGKVSPLLGRRVALAVETAQKFPTALLVMSGGQGNDEPRSEAAAMAEYASELGAPAERLVMEDTSRTTEENLINTRQVLVARDEMGPLLAVTSDYHAFRAANLLRRLQIAGHAIGARTAKYYVPSALLREYLALLRDHRKLNLVMLTLATLPLLGYIVFVLVSGVWAA